jgi:hypothetical protein
MTLEMLAHLAWRWYLAIPLMALGVALAIWGANRGVKGLRGAIRGDSAQLVPFMEGFRAFAIGLALAGIGAAWAWHLTWLLVLSCAMGGGETLETSLILFALRHGARLEIGKPRTRAEGGELRPPHRPLPASSPLACGAFPARCAATSGSS